LPLACAPCCCKAVAGRRKLSRRCWPVSAMSSLQAATARMGTGPTDGVGRRSRVLLDKLTRQERRYVNDWKYRIDLAATTEERLQQHVAKSVARRDVTAERAKSRAADWADRAEEAARWRQIVQMQRMEKCASACDAKERKLENFMKWHTRVLVDDPRQQLDKRTDWLLGQQSQAVGEVDRYRASRLGPKSGSWSTGQLPMSKPTPLDETAWNRTMLPPVVAGRG